MTARVVIPWTGYAALEFADVLVPAGEVVRVVFEWVDKDKRKLVSVETAAGVRVTLPAGVLRVTGEG